VAVVVSGALAGLGGAYLSFVLGKWHPVGALGAALLFGFAQALGNSLQTSAAISANLVSILPYALTLVVLVGVVGRSVAPAAVGRPYQKQ
jgi:simple sugar transport system permease protein